MTPPYNQKERGVPSLGTFHHQKYPHLFGDYETWQFLRKKDATQKNLREKQSDRKVHEPLQQQNHDMKQKILFDSASRILKIWWCMKSSIKSTQKQMLARISSHKNRDFVNYSTIPPKKGWDDIFRIVDPELNLPLPWLHPGWELEPMHTPPKTRIAPEIKPSQTENIITPNRFQRVC